MIANKTYNYEEVQQEAYPQLEVSGQQHQAIIRQQLHPQDTVIQSQSSQNDFAYPSLDEITLPLIQNVKQNHTAVTPQPVQLESGVISNERKAQFQLLQQQHEQIKKNIKSLESPPLQIDSNKLTSVIIPAGTLSGSSQSLEFVQVPSSNGNKLFIKHKVEPLHDTLTRISMLYQVSKSSIQQTNNFTGDEIFCFKELLIPVKNEAEARQAFDKSAAQGLCQEITDEQRKRDDLLLKNISIQMLADLICNLEYKNQSLFQKASSDRNKKYIFNDKKSAEQFKSEAEFYLDEANYNLTEAIKKYKADLQIEIDHCKAKLNAKGTKKVSTEVNDEVQQQGCQKCSIF